MDADTSARQTRTLGMHCHYHHSAPNSLNVLVLEMCLNAATVAMFCMVVELGVGLETNGDGAGL